MKMVACLMKSSIPYLFVGGLCLLVAGCGQQDEKTSGSSPDKHEAAASHTHEDHHEGEEHSHGHSHAHTAPHGGTLVLMGDHFAFVELVLDSATGKMTGYILDGEAEKPVRISQPAIEMLILKPESPETGPPIGDLIKLNAAANTLTGESVGDTSEFVVTSDLLKGKDHFEGIVQSVTIKGEEIKGVSFHFPEGNE